MWIKLTEAKGDKRSVLFNTDNIAYMSVSDKGTDTYIKIKETEAHDTFYFVKESVDEIYRMLSYQEICAPANLEQYKMDWEMSNKGPISYVPGVRGLSDLK